MSVMVYAVGMLNILCLCIATLPEISQIVYVNMSDDVVVIPKQINFRNGDNPAYFLDIPSRPNGKFYQLSDVFSKYGYAPCRGKELRASSVITGSKGRFVYKVNMHALDPGILDIATIVIDLVDHNTVLSGKIVFLPSTGTFVSSDFLLSDDGWRIVSNHPIHTPLQEPTYCNWNSHFIAGTDNYVHYNTQYHYDNSVWYFQAPMKYNTDLSLAYLGWIDFYQVFLSGDYSRLNPTDLFPIVRIRCENRSYSIAIEYYSTVGPVAANHMFHIKLDENLWRISSKDNRKMSKRVFVDCLANVDSLEILGDWTVGLETVGLDSVRIYKERLG
jgi:hypothetical protein